MLLRRRQTLAAQYVPLPPVPIQAPAPTSAPALVPQPSSVHPVHARERSRDRSPSGSTSSRKRGPSEDVPPLPFHISRSGAASLVAVQTDEECRPAKRRRERSPALEVEEEEEKEEPEREREESEYAASFVEGMRLADEMQEKEIAEKLAKGAVHKSPSFHDIPMEELDEYVSGEEEEEGERK